MSGLNEESGTDSKSDRDFTLGKDSGTGRADL